jgi:hypothetical protein
MGLVKRSDFFKSFFVFFTFLSTAQEMLVGRGAYLLMDWSNQVDHPKM